MTEDKRTRAELLAALADVERKGTEYAQSLKARLDRQTPEARAIDMCVTALDALKQENDRSSRSNTGYLSAPTYAMTYSGGYVEPFQLDAVGQVLAYLRIKYGVPDRSGEVDHLLNQVDRLHAENTALREQLQQVQQMAGGTR